MFDFIKNGIPALFQGLLRTQDRIAPDERPRTYRLFVMDAGFWSGMNTLQAGPFIVAFALAIGASNYEIGLITSMMFIGMLMQIPGIFLVQHFPQRRAISVICSSISRLMWIPIILIPFLFVDRGITFMLQFLLLSAVIGGTAIPAWHSFMKDSIAPEDLSNVLARRTIWAIGVALVLTIAGGLFIDLWNTHVPEAPLYGYSVLFAVGMILGLAGTVSIYFLPEPKMKIADKRVGRIILDPFRDIRFLKLLKFAAPWAFAVHMSMPFFIVYLYKRLDFSVLLVTAIVATGQLSQMFFARIWSPLIGRLSSKSVLSVACWIFLGNLLLWPFLTMPERHPLTVPLAFLIFAINGMAIAGTMLSTMNASLKLSPAGKAHTYTTAYMMIVGVSAAVAAMLGGVLAEFFAARDISFAAINLKTFDFVFLIAFAIGLIAMYRLGKFREEGEVGEEKVLEGLLGRLSASFRIATSTSTYRRLSLYLLYPFR